MNEANTATCNAYGRPARLAGRIGRAAWQVREDRESYMPDFLSLKLSEISPELRDAADKDARHLRRAQRNLEQAINLVGVLLSSLEDVGDSRAMQAETALKVIEQKLDKALTRLDKHATRHSKLYFAYFELKENAEDEESGEE
jgi:hypothetical protein